MLGAKTFTSFFLFLLLPLKNFVVGTEHLAWVQTITYPPPPPLPIPSPTGVPLREKPTCTVMKNYLDSMFLNSGCSKPPPTLTKSRWRFKDYLHQHWWCLSQWKGPLLLNLKIIQINRNTLVTDIRIECFHSRGQHLCKFIGKKGSVCIRKEFNSQRIVLGHQHGRRFIVLGHQYGCRDVM